MQKIGPLGVAVFDCIVSGACPSVLVGRYELGAPSLYRVKKVRREVGELVNNQNSSHCSSSSNRRSVFRPSSFRKSN